jgi:dUTP pyrophosphatase
MAKFEKVSKFAEVDINLPMRKTADSAGYDMEVAEDIIIPSYFDLYFTMKEEYIRDGVGVLTSTPTFDLNSLAAITKRLKTKPTLVSTGMKCQLESGTYLELSVRSSCPLKHWLILANGVGVIDADYYNNPDNEGEIFFQVINLSPFDIQLHKGDIIGQGIIKPYLTTEDDNGSGKRVGGFGSTSV